MKGKTTADDVRAVILKKMKIRDLFTKDQRAFYKANAPDGLKLSALSVLGPINLMKLEFDPDGLKRNFVAELWMYPDGSRILELSTKASPEDAFPRGRRNARFPEEEGSRPHRRAAAQDQPGAQALHRPAEKGSGQELAMAEIKPRWEWRTFGTRFARAEAVFAGLETKGVQETDEIYLLTEKGSNVKIRAGLLDIKVLQTGERGGPGAVAAGHEGRLSRRRRHAARRLQRHAGRVRRDLSATTTRSTSSWPSSSRRPRRCAPPGFTSDGCATSWEAAPPSCPTSRWTASRREPSRSKRKTRPPLWPPSNHSVSPATSTRTTRAAWLRRCRASRRAMRCSTSAPTR